MGITGDKPRQLAPTVGTTGSGSTGSPAPSSSSRSCRSHLAYSSGVKLIVGQTASAGFNLVDLYNNNDGSSSRQAEALISLPVLSSLRQR
jgi:hypothetical protein